MESWWLKVKRAQYHLVGIRAELRRYAALQPCKAELVTNPQRAGDYWRFNLKVTERPNALFTAAIGDFVHNLRSALDHWVVAHVPANRSRDAYFPIRHEDPWETDEFGAFVAQDERVRTSFDNAIVGLNEFSKTIIRSIQPYQSGQEWAPRQQIGILSRLENADKHRDSIRVNLGFELSMLTRIGFDLKHETTPPNRFVSEGQQIVSFRQDVPLRRDEVSVTLSTRPYLSVVLPTLGGRADGDDFKFKLPEILLHCLEHVRITLRLLDSSIILEPARTIDIFRLLGEHPDTLLDVLNAHPPPSYKPDY